MNESIRRNIRPPETACFLLLLAMVLAYKCLLLFEFGFVYTDSDQNIMWCILHDYSRGIFNEPGFYGQAYNTGIEALFAVPLYKCGLPAHKALPLVSSFFSLCPFILVAVLTFLKRSTLTALIILSLPLLLPVEYGLLTTMPRGFVPGLFFAGIVCVASFYPKNKWWWCVAAVLSVVAHIVNNSSLLVCAPVLLYLFLINIKDKLFYVFAGTGLLFGGILLYAFTNFYNTHPRYVIHGMPLDYAFTYLVKAFKKLDLYFNYNCPVFHKSGFFVLFFFAGLALFFLIRRKTASALTCIFVPLLVLSTFGFNKLHDGNDFLFFHYARMFLALPLSLAFCIALIEPQKEPRLYFLWLIVPVAFFINILYSYPEAIKKGVAPYQNAVVGVLPADEMIRDCKAIHDICRATKCELLIVADHFYHDVINYGCAACTDDFPNTLRPVFERRTWRLLEDEHRVYQNVMITDLWRDFSKEYPGIRKLDHSLFLLQNNTLPTRVLLDSLRIHCREYK